MAREKARVKATERVKVKARAKEKARVKEKVRVKAESDDRPKEKAKQKVKEKAKERAKVKAWTWNGKIRPYLSGACASNHVFDEPPLSHSR